MAVHYGALRDWLYLWIAGVQLFGMMALDLVAFYPKSLYHDPSAPLHFLVTLREHYITTTHDPFFANSHDDAPYAPWFEIFLYIEAFVQLPLAAYLVYALARRRPATGAAEVAGLAFGCLTFMGSAACCFELYHMEDFLIDEEKKHVLLYCMYLPYAVVPGLMAVDMSLRLLDRISTAEAKEKTQ